MHLRAFEIQRPFNEVDIRIYLPEKANITFKGR